jgi:DNA-directed RNA polymerase subunit M/transcription elongation factor TFIIS
MAKITFYCPHCNQVLEATEDLAGEIVECPGCQAEIAVPDEVDFEEDAEEAYVATGVDEGVCPGCGAEMEPDAVLCLGCGYHATLGHKISTSFDDTDEEDA